MIYLSKQASNAMLDRLANMLDGGSIEFLAENDHLLAVLRLSDPAAFEAVEGELEFRDIGEEDAALGQGSATMARIIGGNGEVAFLCTVGDESSDAVIKLTGTTMIYRGQPVRLHSFRLVMPNGG
jgi:hypothetical protein